MDFQLSPAQAQIRDTARKLAQSVLQEHAAAVDAGQFPLTGLSAVAKAGLLGIKVDPKWGGLGGDNVAYCAAIAEVSEVCASTAVAVAVTNMVADMIELYGSDEQKDRYLAPTVRGDWPAASFALSESGAGSDAASLRCKAEKTATGWRLTGSKQWITSGDVAGVILVMARTTPEPGARNITAFLVNGDAAGLSVGRHEEKLGLHGSSTVTLQLDGVEVSDDQVLGGLGRGFEIAMVALDGGRCGIGAQALGMGRRALRGAAQHLQVRAATDKALGTDQGSQFRLADMATRLDAAALMVWRAAWLKDTGKKMSKEAAMAKVMATEAANFVCQTALQLIGAAALDSRHPVVRAFRDVRVSRIYEGTSEVQRLVVARTLAAGVAPSR
jgi:alkylation response protein AidB-like acyl-CoA dehydrogenase